MNYLHVSLILSLIVIMILMWFCYNLFIQNLQYEKFIEKDNKAKADLISQVDAFYKRHLEIFTHAGLEMDKIDKKGSFSSDDEVGFAFIIIKRAIDDAREQLHNMYKSED